MTAHEWDTTTNVHAMLQAVRGGVSDRKLMLFAGGCCRLVEGRVPLAAAAAKQFEAKADRRLKAEEKFTLVSSVFQFVFGNPDPVLEYFLGRVDQDAWNVAAQVASFVRQFQARRVGGDAEPLDPGEPPVPSDDSPEQATVLREIVGHPFRDVPIDARWRTETAVGLAAAIDEQQAWDRMPILADALQDAGCESPEVLAHCRDSQQVHRRGCWVIDAILDRP